MPVGSEHNITWLNTRCSSELDAEEAGGEEGEDGEVVCELGAAATKQFQSSRTHTLVIPEQKRVMMNASKCFVRNVP